VGLLSRRPAVHPYLDSLPVPVALLDERAVVLQMSPAFARLLGVERKEALGKKAGEFFPHLAEEIALACLKAQGLRRRLSLGDRHYELLLSPPEEGQTRSLLLEDITEFVRLQEELRRRNRELMVINTISSVFISAHEMAGVFHKLIEKVMLITDLSSAWMVLKEEDELVLKAAAGVSRVFREKLQEGALEGLHRQAQQCREPLLVLEAEELEAHKELLQEGFAFLVGIPIRVGLESVGVLVVAHRSAVEFDFDMASLLQLVGNYTSLVVEKVRLFQEAERLAITDGLTGIFNIRYFYESLNNEVARTRRYNTPFSIAIYDIDNFKQINDTYGHQAGDEVLKAVAGIMRQVSRKSDIVARYGGEEFVVILPNTTKQEALSQALRLKESVEGAGYLDGAIRLTISGGIATFPEDASDDKGLLYAADMALYEAKARGKRQIRLAGRWDEKTVRKT